jgi:hypothetical protein
MTTKKANVTTAKVSEKKPPVKKRTVPAKPILKPVAKLGAKAAPQRTAKKAKHKMKVVRDRLILLAELNPGQLKRTLGSLEKIKTGRPKKH